MLLIYLMLVSLDLIKLVELKDWKCPEINQKPLIECSCDLPHTLRCNGDKEALKVINSILKNTPVSLLDCTLQGLKFLPAYLLRNVSLHGLVVSSGEIVKVHELAFSESLTPIQALGLPNNQLMSVPDKAIGKLSDLERLDLSRNRIKTISRLSFRGLEKLQYLDMSENRLEEISSEAFQMKPKFHVLRLRGNRLNITHLWKIANAQNLQEFDISANVIIGPLVTNMLPKLDYLKELYMNHNLISSVQQYALSSCKNITILSLNHNQIDVIEDYAFANLNLLRKLDLAHNRIVTVSNSSLANLGQLQELDLSYNFLRVLNSDLVQYLTLIQTLLLDYNDISMVEEHVFDHNKYLQKFNLIDNPLNCDCSLIWFMKWLTNQTELSNDDKSTIICTTPPHLENAVLIELSESYLYCSQDHQDDYYPNENVTKSTGIHSDSHQMENLTTKNSEVKFKNFWSTQNDIYLQWQIVHSSRAYKCDALFIYSELNNSEQLIETKPLKCHSDNFENSNILNIEFKRNSTWHFQDLFRFCLALMLEDKSEPNPLRGNFIFGCSNLIQLIANQEFVEIGNKNLLNIQTRFGNAENLSVFVNVSAVNKAKTISCSLNVTLLESTTSRLFSHQHRLLENCSLFSSQRFDFNLKPTIFTYSVCISLLQKDDNHAAIVTAQEKCVVVERKRESNWNLNPQTKTIFTALMSAICVLFAIAAVLWLGNQYLSLNNATAISGLNIKSPDDEDENEDQDQDDIDHRNENGDSSRENQQQFNGYVQLDTSPD